MKLKSWWSTGAIAGIVCVGAVLGCSKSGKATQSINGTWVSGTTTGKRGTLELSGTNLTSAGSVSGTLVLHGGGEPDTTDSITGTTTEVINVGSTDYDTIDVQTSDGKLSLFGTLFDQMMGTYQNERTGDSGSWHEVADGISDCVVDRALQTSYTFRDLAFDGTNLFGVGTAETAGAQVELVRIDPTTGAVTSLSPSPACPSPSGIAFDGSAFLISRQIAGAGWVLDKYDSSWHQVGTDVAVTGTDFDPPASISFHDGKLWSAGMLSFGVTTIDPASGVATLNSNVQPDRPAGLDFVGDQLWALMFPPGGVWPELIAYDVSTGATQATVYAPENKGEASEAITAEPGFLWVAYGHDLYRLQL